MCAERDRKTETSEKKIPSPRPPGVQSIYDDEGIIITQISSSSCIHYIMTPQCSGMQSLGVLYTLTSGPAVATAHTQRTICMHVEVYNIRSCVMVLQVYTVYTGRRPRCARNRIYYLYNIYVLNTICRRIIIIIFTGFKTPLTRRFLRNDRNSSGTIPTLYNNM